MARPKKATVDYFPFYVKDGRTLFILESKYGCKGTGFFTNVLRFLCSTPDHHYCVSGGRNSDKLYFFSKLHCDEESGMDMLNIMAETGKINKDLWLEHNIIFSEDLIGSISDAYRKRENKPLTKHEIMEVYGLSAEETVKQTEETSGNELNGGNNQQRKEKKRKEKILLTDAEWIEKLTTSVAYKHIDIEIELAKMDEWLALPKNKHRNKTRKFILTWLNRIDKPITTDKNNNSKKKYFSTVADIEKEEREHGVK